MEQVKAALIGYGGMGSKYAEIIHSGQAGTMSLVGICCRNQKGQQEIRAKYPELTIYRDSEDMFAHRSDFDTVIIVTPHDTHAEIGLRAIGLGLHVLCDKPLGISSKEARDLCEAATEAGVKLGTIFNVRANPGYQKAKEMIGKGELGDISRAVWICNTWFRTMAYHKSAPWRSTWAGERGGLLINQCQHYLDIWQWLFGMPEQIDACLEYGRFNPIQVDDSVDIRMGYENGMRGNFISSTGETPGVNRLEIWGTKGRLTVENNNTVTFEKNEVSTVEFGSCNTDIYGSIGHSCVRLETRMEEEAYSCVMRRFAEAVCQEGTMIADGTDGLNTLTLANGAYLSSWLEKKIILPFDEELYEEMLKQKIESYT